MAVAEGFIERNPGELLFTPQKAAQLRSRSRATIPSHSALETGSAFRGFRAVASAFGI